MLFFVDLEENFLNSLEICNRRIHLQRLKELECVAFWQEKLLRVAVKFWPQDAGKDVESFANRSFVNKQNRFHTTREFQLLYKRGRRVVSDYIKVFCLLNSNSVAKVGVVVSKKTGKAVERNRFKRRVRAYFSSRLLDLTNLSFVVLSRNHEATTLPYKVLEKQLDKAIFRIKQSFQ